MAFFIAHGSRVTTMTLPFNRRTSAGYLTIDEVLALAPWSRATLYRRIGTGAFPPSRKRIGHRALWSTDDVREALADRSFLLYRTALGLF